MDYKTIKYKLKLYNINGKYQKYYTTKMEKIDYCNV